MPQKLPDEWFRPTAPHDDDPTVVSPRGHGADGGGRSDRPDEPDTIAHSWQASDLRTPFEGGLEPTTNPGLTRSTVERPRSRPRGLVAAAVVVAVVIAGVTGVFLGQWLFGGLDRTDPGENTATSAEPSLPVPWDGPLKAVSPTGVEADCTAPPAKDSSGQQVRYDAEFVMDGKPETAWRCPGDGVGKTLTFTFPSGATIAGVRMSNGYTKTDAASGESLYGQYRRILRVRWDMPNGSYFAQTFSDNGSGQQEIRIPVTDAAGAIRLTIEESTSPGEEDTNRDAVLISEITFLAPA